MFGYCGPSGTSFTDPCNWSLEGNPDLRPEKSDTTTFGFVVSPKDWVDGLQFSVDYFRINIKDAIQQANVQDVEDGCRIRNDPADCALITFDGTTYDVNGVTYRGISDIRALSFNGAAYTFKGLDFSSTYNMQLNNGANLTFRLLAENMMRQVFQNNPRTAPINVVGQTGTANTFLADNQPQPKWTGSLTGTYAQGPQAVTGQVRFVSHGITDYNDPDGLNYSDSRVPSYQVFTLSGTYNLKNIAAVDTLQLFAVVDNLFGGGGGGGGGGTSSRRSQSGAARVRLEQREWRNQPGVLRHAGSHVSRRSAHDVLSDKKAPARATRGGARRPHGPRSARRGRCPASRVRPRAGHARPVVPRAYPPLSRDPGAPRGDPALSAGSVFRSAAWSQVVSAAANAASGTLASRASQRRAARTKCPRGVGPASSVRASEFPRRRSGGR